MMKAETNHETKNVEHKAAPKADAGSHKNLAIVLVRGTIGLHPKVKDTLKMMNLKHVNNCVILKASPSNVGMIKKVKDFVTYGDIDDQTLKSLTEKRGKEGSKVFLLNPPRKGYGRKGIKRAFSIGGALGYRGQKINDLLRRMI